MNWNWAYKSTKNSNDIWNSLHFVKLISTKQLILKLDNKNTQFNMGDNEIILALEIASLFSMHDIRKHTGDLY